MTEFDKNTTCSFTGHRPEKLNMSERECKEKLKTEIKKAISDGFVTFISGMAKGIDIWAGELVLELKKDYPHINLILAYPYKTFNVGTTPEEKKKISYLRENSLDTYFIQTEYSISSFQKRNMWMVDHSSRVIAFFNGAKGGTLNTINYARQENVETVIIN